MIRLYHGSNMKIEVPNLLRSKPFKDFGRGICLSPSKQQAWDMALQKVNQTIFQMNLQKGTNRICEGT